MKNDLLEQIERELAALPEIDVDYVNGPVWFGISGTIEGSEPEEVPFCFGEEANSSEFIDGFTPAYFELLAHAPAHIRALLPVVRAALVWQEWNQTPGGSGDTEPIMNLLAAVRAFKEGHHAKE